MYKCNGNELSRSSFDYKIDSNDIIFGTSEKKKQNQTIPEKASFIAMFPEYTLSEGSSGAFAFGTPNMYYIQTVQIIRLQNRKTTE